MAKDKDKTKSKPAADTVMSDEKSKKSKKSKKSATKSVAEKTNQKSFSLLAEDKNVDSKLSSLFAAKPTPPVSKKVSVQPAVQEAAAASSSNDTTTTPIDDTEGPSSANDQDDNHLTSARSARKRRRGDAEDDLEDRYMQKLTEEPKAKLRKKERQEKHDREDDGASEKTEAIPQESASDKASAEEVDDAQSEASADSWSPPKHETEVAASNELDKAGRTVFLGNVSVNAITMKSARKELEKHLVSFKTTTDDAAGKKILESMRFRSTPYSPTLPKKAAFATKQVITATTQSTNAYAVYSTQAYAREAVRKLNGSVVLDRHLRVDLVAHPTPVEHRKCVFIGNLGFVDDESNITAANEADGREKRKTKQKPSDVEEGLWRLFGKHGTVESVRVIRDKGTRVGKGIAYVQFSDENGVESALAEDGKKDPPMLPRRLRVTRAKAIKRKPTAAIASKTDGPNGSLGYRRKITPGEASQKGRIGKLMGRAAAALATTPQGFKPPESFIFEGHRAKANQSKAGFKLGKPSRSSKPAGRSTRRAATFRAGGGKKKTSK